MIQILKEHPKHIKAIREVNLRAFGQPQEAGLVDTLRQNCKDLLSLVAVMRNQVVGHILFSPVSIESQKITVQGMALGPMAVMPEYQRQGIGSKLVRTGIEKVKTRPCPFIIVLGHVDYYPRFGFEPASLYNIRSEWEVPDEAFMVLVLNTPEMNRVSGVAKYRLEFTETM